MNHDQERRYVRQTMLPEIGVAGQEKLLAAHVLIVGAGGLGAPLITALSACGVGHIGIIDDDRVELSNLPRQTIYETGDIGRLKVDAASDRVAELNPHCEVITFPFALTAENAQEIISQYDLVADGCDNFATRFVVNDTCVALSKPLVSAAISGFQGQVMTVIDGSPDYRTLVHEEAPDANTCRESGVMGPLAGLVGQMQALEVVRVILGFPALKGKLAILDGITQQQRIVALTRD
jgi:molybdopterin/thiamine biosynthesis adenylyltransferase